MVICDLLFELSSFIWNKNKFESREKMCKKKNICNIVMPSEDTKMLEFNQYHKSDKAPFIIYVDLGSLIEGIDGYKSHPENSSTTKVGEHI